MQSPFHSIFFRMYHTDLSGYNTRKVRWCKLESYQRFVNHVYYIWQGCRQHWEGRLIGLLSVIQPTKSIRNGSLTNNLQICYVCASVSQELAITPSHPPFFDILFCDLSQPNLSFLGHSLFPSFCMVEYFSFNSMELIENHSSVFTELEICCNFFCCFYGENQNVGTRRSHTFVHTFLYYVDHINWREEWRRNVGEWRHEERDLRLFYSSRHFCVLRSPRKKSFALALHELCECKHHWIWGNRQIHRDTVILHTVKGFTESQDPWLFSGWP